MAIYQHTETGLNTSAEVDLQDLIQLLWKRRWIIGAACLFTFLVSAFYAYKIAKPEFVSSALLIPTQSSNNSDQLGMAAAFIGRKSGIESSDADLYQGLLTSRTVIRKLLLSSVDTNNSSSQDLNPPLYKVLDVDTADPGAMEQAIEGISRSVIVAPKDGGSGGILEVRFSSNTPHVAQVIGQSLLEIGQEELRHIRVLRSESILPRIAATVNQAKAEWDSVARRVAWYKDKNRSITLPEQVLELSRFQMEQQVREQKYMLARKEYEMLIFEREKASPPMMILDPPNLPAKKIKPKRSLIMAAGLLFGLMGSVVILLMWEFLATRPSVKKEE